MTQVIKKIDSVVSPSIADSILTSRIGRETAIIIAEDNDNKSRIHEKVDSYNYTKIKAV